FLVLLQLLLSLIYSGLSYEALFKELMRAGVFYKWQMLVTIVIAIPCHELYIRTILQNQLQQKLSQPIIAIVIAALASSSLFLYETNYYIIYSSSSSYYHTRNYI